MSGMVVEVDGRQLEYVGGKWFPASVEARKLNDLTTEWARLPYYVGDPGASLFRWITKRILAKPISGCAIPAGSGDGVLD